MKLVGRIPVEPLDDERLTNLERRIVANAAVGPVRASPWRLYAFAGVAVVAMIALVVGWKLHDAPEPQQPIAEPSKPIIINTDKDQTIDIGDATITSSPGTALTITRPDGGVLVAMEHGKVELQVAKRHGKPPLIVRAGDTDVEVVGTHFTVDYHDGIVEVRVTEGVVKVRHAHEEERVAAGNAYKTKRGVVAMADLDALPEIDMDKPEAKIDTDTKPVLRDHVAVVPDAHHDTPHGDSSALSTGAKHTLDDPRDPNKDLKAEIRRQPVLPAMDAGNDPIKAIIAYREIWSKQKNTEASKALYSTAVVQSLRLGRDADALQTLDMYLNRFTGFDEYNAALWLRVRILCLRKFDDSCRAAATSYMQKASGTTSAAVAELIANTP